MTDEKPNLSMKTTGQSSQGTEVQVRIGDGPLRTGVVRDGVLFIYQNAGDAHRLGRIVPRQAPMSPYADSFTDITIFEDDYPGSPLIREFAVRNEHPSETDAATEESIKQTTKGWEATVGEGQPAEPVDVQMLRMMTEIRDLAKELAAKAKIPPQVGPFYHYVPQFSPVLPSFISESVDRTPWLQVNTDQPDQQASTSEESAKKVSEGVKNARRKVVDSNRMFVVPEPEYGSFAIVDNRVHIDLPRDRFNEYLREAVVKAFEEQTGSQYEEGTIVQEERLHFGRQVVYAFEQAYFDSVRK
ncbi:hypothetical protein KNU02_gp03 [Gordonia phage Pleakley]|uniref:Uncharacterized protein n=1 Tax=Gordonia phage Pleakley TaxID=2283246 RepID=A0A345M6C1_9CAUD|nr:hypothetical protein KNU02_gp03 [Gordonia phage Pleakley]AXH49729.1 hypothetical protein SEA_FURY_3 [Gordonia phage Fury]AXH66042.1 hypothetical protein SEA_PLEAKLEY_3 [Gordonia phage Pleakley]